MSLSAYSNPASPHSYHSLMNSPSNSFQSTDTESVWISPRTPVFHVPAQPVSPLRSKNLHARQQRHGNHLSVHPHGGAPSATSPRVHNLTVRNKQVMADHSALPLDATMVSHLVAEAAPTVQGEPSGDICDAPCSPMTAPAAPDAPTNSFDFELLPSAMNARRGMKMAKLSTIECKYGRKCYRSDCRFAHSFVERQLYGPAPKPPGQSKKNHHVRPPVQQLAGTYGTRSATSSPIFEPVRTVTGDIASDHQWPRGPVFREQRFKGLALPGTTALVSPPPGLGDPSQTDFKVTMLGVTQPIGGDYEFEAGYYGYPVASRWMSSHAPSALIAPSPYVGNGCRSPPPRSGPSEHWPHPQYSTRAK